MQPTTNPVGSCMCSERRIEMIKYNLTETELQQLRIVCRYTGVKFEAMASRPKVAKQFIKNYLKTDLLKTT
jgi:hypothetical protein